MCVTFTNKAAQEMKKRVKKLIGDSFDISLITTYHGFCVKFLREDINKIFYPKGFLILDTEDQKQFLRNIYTELNITSRDLSFKQVFKYISNSKKGLDYLNYVLQNKTIETNKDDKLLNTIFQKYLEKQNVITL